MQNSYGEFFIKLELADNPDQEKLIPLYVKSLNEVLSKYSRHLAGTKDIFGKIEKLRQLLFQDFFYKYSRDYARIIDFLESRGGNCEAQTKLFIHCLTGLRIVFPPGLVLGVQQFKDHIQPVVYMKNGKEVWDLISGKKTKEIVAPVYKPQMLYHAFLQGFGIKPNKTVEELLIVESVPQETNKQKANPNNEVKTNTSLNFSGGEGYFAEGEIPENANMSYQPSHRAGYNKNNFFQNFKLWWQNIVSK